LTLIDNQLLALFRANTKNAVELERMLIRRRDKALGAAEKAHQASRPSRLHDQHYLGANDEADLPPRYEDGYQRNESMTAEPKGRGKRRGCCAGQATEADGLNPMV